MCVHRYIYIYISMIMIMVMICMIVIVATNDDTTDRYIKSHVYVCCVYIYIYVKYNLHDIHK